MDLVAAQAKVGGGSNVVGLNLTPAMPRHLAPLLGGVVFIGQAQKSPVVPGFDEPLIGPAKASQVSQ